MTRVPATDGSLAEEARGLWWYHTIELAPGVETPGWHDTRSIVDEIPFPRSLAGKRCLDVGTFDGFWAFEMERRGAAEVVAIDVPDPDDWDWPANSDPAVIAEMASRQGAGRGFALARRALGSSVERVPCSVYDIDEDRLGRFDVIFVGSLLIHLRDPARALERLRAVCDETLILMDGIDLLLDVVMPRRAVASLHAQGRPWWWYSNRAALRQLLEAGGFEVVAEPKRIFMPPGKGQPLEFHPRQLKTRNGWHQLVVARRGDPHAVAVACPRR